MSQSAHLYPDVPTFFLFQRGKLTTVTHVGTHQKQFNEVLLPSTHKNLFGFTADTSINFIYFHSIFFFLPWLHLLVSNHHLQLVNNALQLMV